MLPNTLCSEPVKKEGTKSRTAKTQCDKLTVSLCSGGSTQLWFQLKSEGFPKNFIAQNKLQRQHIRSRVVLYIRMDCEQEPALKVC